MKTTIKTIDELPVSLKAEHIADFLGISRGGAYNLLNSEGFPALRVGKRIVVAKDDFIRWVGESTNIKIDGENKFAAKGNAEFQCRLRQLRKLRNLTQKVCAEKLGVELANYNKWENGVAPNFETLIKIADFFDVSLDYLLGRSAEYYNNSLYGTENHILELVIKTIDVLSDITNGIDNSPKERIEAARLILEYGLRYISETK